MFGALLTLHLPTFQLGEPRGGSSSGGQPSPTLDPAYKRIMVYVFVASRGAQNRVRIAEMLRSEPSNLNRITQRLGLDYKTVQHHVKVLEDNGVVIPSAKGTYGAVYFLTPYFDKHFDLLKEMWARFGQS
ncbi:MAG: winged helix-turn-helix transcriptional regulator [Nitrososphaerota archaeon]|nr:winged helix-turn-helix transcriptional regulator [Nitrososphaerota archaeon]